MLHSAELPQGARLRTGAGKVPGVLSPSPPGPVSCSSEARPDAERRKLSMTLIKWGLAFGAEGSHVTCGPSAPQGRDKRGCQCREMCLRTSLASDIPSTLIPQSCLLPAQPSRVKGVVQSHAQYCCCVTEPSPQSTSLRAGGEGGTAQAGASVTGILPSLRTSGPGLLWPQGS